MNNKTFLYTTLGILAALLLASSSVSAQTYTVGGTMVVVLASEPTTVDPLTLSWNAGFVGAQLFNSLLTYDENLQLKPSLATKWSVNAAEGTYTFELRTDVKWHDGKPFTPEDVKFAFENIISKYDVFGASYFKNTTVEIRGNTVVIKPKDFLPGIQIGLFASSDTVIYPKHILEGQDFLKSEFRTTSPIGTGPFKMKTWVKGSYMELVRNEDYFNKPKPYLERIVIRFVKEPAAIIAGLQRGELHYIFRGVPFEAYSTLKASPNLRVIPHPRPPYVSALWMNLGNKYLADVNVRQAMAYAINRTDIALKATQGISPPVQYMVDPTIVPPSPTLTIYNYDKAKANQILDSAGYSKGADGMRFKLELMTRTGEPDEQLWATLVKDYLADIGIDVSIKTVDFATFLSLQTKLQYDMCTIKYWISPIWLYQLFSTEWIGKGSFTNNFQYSNKEVDALFARWLKETDPQAQVKILQQIEDYISRDLPELVLYEVRWLNVINNDFQGEGMPVGKWVFADSLENIYSVSAQKTPITTTPQTTTMPAATTTVTSTVTITQAAPTQTITVTQTAATATTTVTTTRAVTSTITTTEVQTDITSTGIAAVVGIIIGAAVATAVARRGRKSAA
ncbi:MAG: ABC transporter substrate-binding protein [Nitrososphaerales archaeon]